MLKAISIAAAIEVALVVIYMGLARLMSSPVPDGTVAHVYLQYEAIFAFNLLESILPPWAIGSLAGYRAIPVAILFRLVTLIPAMIMLGSNDFISFLAGRPISLHLTYLFCAGGAAYIAATRTRKAA